MSKANEIKENHGNKFIKTETHKLPEDKKHKLRKVKKLEWLTLAYLTSVVIVMYLTLGSSQAMKAAWLEDILSMVPAIAFLVAYAFFDKRPPDHKFLYGFHKLFSVAFLIGSFALLGMGLFTFYDSVMALVKAEHPTIPFKNIFGYEIWMGWLMIAALLWSFIPAVLLGRSKLPYAKELHNKILYTDANAQKADWQTAGAAIIGIIGVGFGLWWFDAVAALFISINIMKDGFTRTKGSITDIIEQIPTKIESDDELHPLNFKIYEYFKNLEWVKDVRVRLRENGSVFFGEVFVIPKDMHAPVQNIIALTEKSYDDAQQLDWKVHDLTIQVVKGFTEED